MRVLGFIKVIYHLCCLTLVIRTLEIHSGNKSFLCVMCMGFLHYYLLISSDILVIFIFYVNRGSIRFLSLQTPNTQTKSKRL